MPKQQSVLSALREIAKQAGGMAVITVRNSRGQRTVTIVNVPLATIEKRIQQVIQ